MKISPILRLKWEPLISEETQSLGRNPDGWGTPLAQKLQCPWLSHHPLAPTAEPVAGKARAFNQHASADGPVWKGR